MPRDVCLVFFIITCVCGRVVFEETLNTSSSTDLRLVKTELDENDLKLIDQTNNYGSVTCDNTSFEDLDEITDNRIDSLDNVLCHPVVRIDNGTALILTPYIEEGHIEEARNASIVDENLFLGVKSYSGFLTVNKTYDSHLFFWYFPVEGKPVNDTPCIVWLQGGPGASSLTGLFDEIGPFHIDAEKNFKKNPFSWSRNHSLIIDNPVGTGYSFTNHEDGYAKDMETYSQHLYTAVRQLVQVFPELRTAPLFLAGESYAGKYVPSLGLKIHENKQAPGGDINFKGLIMGNAYVDPAMLVNLTRQYYYLGLLDDNQMRIVQPLIDAFKNNIQLHRNVEAKHNWIYLIVVLLGITNQNHAYNFLRDDLAVGKYVNLLSKTEYKRALHVGDIQFSYFNYTVNIELAPEFIVSAQPKVETLLDHYKVLVYCGQLDLMLSCPATSENYRTWNWKGSRQYLSAVRSPFLHNRKLAGYHKSGGGLTEVLVRGAGHLAPMDAPAPVQEMVSQWTHGQPIGPRSDFMNTYLQEFVRNHSLAFNFV